MREKALALLKQWNENDALVKHGLQVEAIMRHYAQEAGQENAPEGVDYWGCVGLLHDVDYEKYPEEHCKKAVEILQEAGYDQAFIHAVVSTSQASSTIFSRSPLPRWSFMISLISSAHSSIT